MRGQQIASGRVELQARLIEVLAQPCLRVAPRRRFDDLAAARLQSVGQSFRNGSALPREHEEDVGQGLGDDGAQRRELVGLRRVHAAADDDAFGREERWRLGGVDQRRELSSGRPCSRR